MSTMSLLLRLMYIEAPEWRINLAARALLAKILLDVRVPIMINELREII